MTEASDSNKGRFIILFVEDDNTTCQVCDEYLTANGFKVHVAYCAEEALEILGETSVDLVITNNNMPGMKGLDLTKLLKTDYNMDVIITTGYRKTCSHEDAISAGAAELLYKPFRLKDLLLIIKRIGNK